MPGYWKMALAYLSTANPNSYYLAFEDWEGADRTSWQGNDGDFNDKVFRINGVTCDGGGEPCDTGMPGVCAQGVTECQVGAGIICKPAVIKKAPRSATTSTTTATAWSTTATACAATELRLQQGRLHPRSATTASSPARSASSATPTGSARIRAAPP